MRPTAMSFSRLSTICEAAPIPGSVNEDACSIWSDGEKITVLVVDGVKQRITGTKLQQLITAYDDCATGASYVAHLTRSITAIQALDDKPLPLQELLLQANTALRSQLEYIYGELTANAWLKAEPQLSFFNEDPRLIRVALPAGVATIARVDLVTRRLEFAHAGDTALFLFYQDGRIVQKTDDQMIKHDMQVFELARTIQSEKGIPFSQALKDERVKEMNLYNGIYHNYVDHNRQVDTKVGIGVIDGLPQLAAYIQQGTVDLNDVTSVLICSDGLIWPAGWNESNDERIVRLQRMRKQIEQLNLSGYLAELRNAEQADTTCDLYPRFKKHDDATGIYLELF